MNKKLYLAFALTLGLGLNSCKSFLDETPESDQAVVNFYQTQPDFYNAITGGYAALKLEGVYANGSGSMMTLMELASDNTAPTGIRSNTTSLYEIEEFTFPKINQAIQFAWVDHYRGIGRVNEIIARLPGALSGATFPQDVKNRFDAEARFLRALYYFNLVRLFGDLQLITEPVAGPFATANVGRSPKEQIYDLIISDLNIAANGLPATIPASEAGRASRWAALALLGKVYLTLGKFADALPILKDVNDKSGRSLMKSYADIFSPTTSYAANTEYIFAVQYKSGLLPQGSNTVGNQGAVGQTQGSDMWSNWAPLGAGSLLGRNGGNGGGFNTPTVDLINAYEAGDARKNASLLTTFMSGPTVVNSAYCVKFRQQGAVSGDADSDFPVLRFGDVVLMYAEALNEQGQIPEAVIQLNRIRTRAGLPSKFVAPAAPATQDALRTAIEQERRVELAFENHRWPDLIRTNKYVPVMQARGIPVKDYHRYYPIPQRETDLNSNLGQNPGY
ncbi:RagB/SusD family nutrient uptake outer membrane protein [Hymenobacter terrenus]|uniref:RagB/SusD family nutrient uptake outer membrane protein n=1 Tax=Hymenobacter terrenus TaxID=1629124 RepID=UPI00061A057D|nr:RagB/SusD family nutrient uptake outer membrane protein [Hymenobacter terrenus]